MPLWGAAHTPHRRTNRASRLPDARPCIGIPLHRPAQLASARPRAARPGPSAGCNNSSRRGWLTCVYTPINSPRLRHGAMLQTYGCMVTRAALLRCGPSAVRSVPPVPLTPQRCGMAPIRSAATLLLATAAAAAPTMRRTAPAENMNGDCEQIALMNLTPPTAKNSPHLCHTRVRPHSPLTTATSRRHDRRVWQRGRGLQGPAGALSHRRHSSAHPTSVGEGAVRPAVTPPSLRIRRSRPSPRTGRARSSTSMCTRRRSRPNTPRSALPCSSVGLLPAGRARSKH